MIARSVLLLPPLIFTIILFSPPPASGQTVRYVSPSGSGLTCSALLPCTLARALSTLVAGDTILMMDGTYTGSTQMIVPPEGVSGTAANPITVRAINDGAVLIDGQGTHRPLELVKNAWFRIEGINVANSPVNVVTIRDSDNFVVRRVVAWNARPDINVHVWNIHRSSHGLLEDVAGFGPARKIYQLFSNANNNVIRRAWGMWNLSTMTTVKQTFSIAYNAYNNLCENCIGTWDADNGAESRDQRAILSNNQMFASDQHPTTCSNSKYFGSIAYVLAEQNAPLTGRMVNNFQTQNCFYFEDLVAISEQGTGLALYRRKSAPPDVWSGVIRNVIEIGVGSSTVQHRSDWTITNHIQADRIEDAPNVWGAVSSLCNASVNGTVTTLPLWPWPMNQRIIDAMTLAGRSPQNVTAIMERLFGPIPSACRSGNEIPQPPRNLRITHSGG